MPGCFFFFFFCCCCSCCVAFALASSSPSCSSSTSSSSSSSSSRVASAVPAPPPLPPPPACFFDADEGGLKRFVKKFLMSRPARSTSLPNQDAYRPLTQAHADRSNDVSETAGFGHATPATHSSTQRGARARARAQHAPLSPSPFNFPGSLTLRFPSLGMGPNTISDTVRCLNPPPSPPSPAPRPPLCNDAVGVVVAVVDPDAPVLAPSSFAAPPPPSPPPASSSSSLLPSALRCCLR